MPVTAHRFPLVSVAFEREVIPIETMMPAKVPDEKWRYVDKQGHGHFWKSTKLPTLEWIVTGTEWVGDEYGEDEYEIGEYRCRLCAEVVEPARRSEYGPRTIHGLGRFTVTIDGEEFLLTEDEYAQSVDTWKQSLRKIRD